MFLIEPAYIRVTVDTVEPDHVSPTQAPPLKRVPHRRIKIENFPLPLKHQSHILSLFYKMWHSLSRSGFFHPPAFSSRAPAPMHLTRPLLLGIQLLLAQQVH
jgi:hypothetical protein